MPTGAHSLFRELREAFPQGHTLLLADFDALPPAEIAAAAAAAASTADFGSVDITKTTTGIDIRIHLVYSVVII